jgi:hypothetical protein
MSDGFLQSPWRGTLQNVRRGGLVGTLNTQAVHAAPRPLTIRLSRARKHPGAEGRKLHLT